MSQLPFAAPQDFKSALHPLKEGESSWFIFLNDQLLVRGDLKKLPTSHEFELQRSLYVGTFKEMHIFAGEVVASSQAPSGWCWRHLRALHGILEEEQFAIAGRALQLIHWDRSHTHCGCCGSATFIRQHERCRECSRCGHLAYPKIAPAIMALVKRDSKILLARSPHFPANVYSVLAGFVDPGETLEQCVVREVLEEVGISVKNVQYFGSQPWPLSHSLMIAFTCDWEVGEIQIDSSEIEDAAWFGRSNLPELPPSLSLSRMLIDACSSIS